MVRSRPLPLLLQLHRAHAGGRMIGKRMGAMLLDGKTLDFYAWQKDGKDVDPSDELLPALRGKIDAMADTWSREQKQVPSRRRPSPSSSRRLAAAHPRQPPAAKQMA